MMSKDLTDLTKLKIGTVKIDAPLKEYCWWKIGGIADILLEPCNLVDLQESILALRDLNIPYVIMGRGSNLLFDDCGIRGAVIKIGSGLSTVCIDGFDVKAEAGIFIPRLVMFLAKHGLAGLEHAVGIPGTLGGLITMNGGSQRQSISTVIKKVSILNADGELKLLNPGDCRFTYRNSLFQKNNSIIIGAELRLNPGKPGIIRSELLNVLRTRRKRLPLKQRSCGSVFLSDPVFYHEWGTPGALIEKCGLKGLRVGNAMISPLHANFILNLGNAKSSDVLALILKAKDIVYRETGQTLHCEVKYISPDCKTMPADLALGMC